MITEPTRPRFCYECSRLQSIVSTAQVKLACNQILTAAQDTADKGLAFKSGVFDSGKAIMIIAPDASWEHEYKVMKYEVFPRRS